jgi:hypothetical protein
VQKKLHVPLKARVPSAPVRASALKWKKKEKAAK